jgi:hypothetical protein
MGEGESDGSLVREDKKEESVSQEPQSRLERGHEEERGGWTRKNPDEKPPIIDRRDTIWVVVASGVNGSV